MNEKDKKFLATYIESNKTMMDRWVEYLKKYPTEVNISMYRKKNIFKRIWEKIRWNTR